MLAVETLTAERLYVDRDAVADLYFVHIAAHSLDHSHHLVAYGDARNGSRHATVLDVEVAGADAAQRYSHQSVGRLLYRWFRFLGQGKSAFFDICICFHYLVDV